MKTIYIYFLLLLFPLFLFTNCNDDDDFCINGTGSIVTRTISVPPFTGISSKGSMDIIIVEGATQEVQAEGHLNIIEDLRTQVIGDKWHIELVQSCYNNYELTITITLPRIEDIAIAGSGNAWVDDFENQGDLDLRISGSGNIDLNKFGGAENLLVEIIGSGNVTGNEDFVDLTNLEIEIDGSGNFGGFPIITNNCEVNLLGSGNAEVNVRDNLTGSILGSGNVLYKGDPNISVNITGSGSLINSN